MLTVFCLRKGKKSSGCSRCECNLFCSPTPGKKAELSGTTWYALLRCGIRTLCPIYGLAPLKSVPNLCHALPDEPRAGLYLQHHTERNRYILLVTLRKGFSTRSQKEHIQLKNQGRLNRSPESENRRFARKRKVFFLKKEWGFSDV